MITSAIQIPQKEIAEFCERHHIIRMALFGSVLRDDFGPESDVDVIVEFHPDHIPGLAFFWDAGGACHNLGTSSRSAHAC
jgi:uncharacterized protein